jgi:CheY-like chemotaxis protein
MDSRTIYYLDIDNEDLYFFKHVIEALGHRISIYKDGYKMMQDLKQSETKPDILFLGSHMPILNGKELIVILKNSEKLKAIPVVIVSGVLPKKLLRHYRDSGVKHIMKRTKVSDYKAAFEEVLEMNFVR